MAKKTKRGTRKAAIPMDWTPEKGIGALPAIARRRVNEAIVRLRNGAPVDSEFFAVTKWTPTIRGNVAYELQKSGFCITDISRLLRMSWFGTQLMLDRIKEQVAMHLPPNWASSSLVDDIISLGGDASWSRFESEQVEEPSMRARHRANAISATSKSAELLSRAIEGQKIVEAIRAAGESKDSERPLPGDRVSTLAWVFQNRILNQREGSGVIEAEYADQAPEPVKLEGGAIAGE